MLQIVVGYWIDLIEPNPTENITIYHIRSKVYDKENINFLMLIFLDSENTRISSIHLMLFHTDWTPIRRIYLGFSTVYYFFLSTISKNRKNGFATLPGTGYPSSKVTMLNGCPVAFLCSLKAMYR